MRTIKLDSGKIFMGLTVILLFVLVVYPVSKIVWQSFLYDHEVSTQNYVRALTRRGVFLALRHSLEISIFSMLGATILGTFLAWLVGRTDLPWRNVFRTAFILPFITPPFIGAIAWQQLLGPVGLLNKLYMWLFSASEPFWNMYGADGIITVMALHIYPLVYITVLGSLERMNPELEEAAQCSGSSIFTVMRTITLPLMLPSIASGAVLVFIACIANFGIPAILGFPENYYVLTTKIFEAVIQSAAANSLSLASALSVLLGLVAGSGLLLQRVYLKKKEYTVLSGKSMQPNIIPLGKHTSWILAFCVLVVLVTSIAPIVSILLTALTKAYGLNPTPANWTLQNFYEVLFENQTARRAIRNSVFLAFSAATAISLLGAMIAYIVVKTKIRGRFVLDLLSNMPYALPGTVVAVAMILAWLRPVPVLGIRLYNTIWILLVAYIARYLAFGVRTTSASLAQIHVCLEEAAHISGANWFQTFRDIVVPLIAPGLFAGWFLVFMPALRELTISTLLWSSRHETIGVMVFNLQESGNTVACAALAVVMMVVLLIANLITRHFTKGRIGF
ncbi:MAG: iron ABC transporter permease [bacterium]|nr:iron ABC transporter permease [bacterium]